MKTPIYGLTGGIASGKSRVLEQFAALGIETLDTDQLARDVIAQGTSGALQLETAIGSEYFQDGCLDRARLRSDMYQSAHLKKTVEAIIHPLVRNAVNQWLDQQSGSPYRILCSPLLIETNQYAMLDGVIVIDAPESEQLKRGTERDAQSKQTIQSIIDAQISRQARLGHASFVIDNSGGLDSLTHQIQTLHEKLSHDMTDDKGHIVACPTCRHETRYHADNPFRPFCSERCRLIDLGEWADEGNRIPGQPVPPEFNDPDIDTY